MRLRDAVRRAVGYHLGAVPPTLAGLGIAGAGVWYGVGAGASASALVGSGRLAPTLGFVLVGTAVAAVGRTAVRIDATAAAVSDRLGGGDSLDQDDLRETVAIATDRAVAASFEGAAAEIEARVVDAVDRAAAESEPSPDARPDSNHGDGVSRADAASRADALDAFAASDPSGPNSLADATRRASERVESYLAEGDAGAFRGLAEGADGVASAASDGATSAGAAPADGAEILDGDRSEGGLPDGTAGGDDAVIIDGDGEEAEGNEMVFGGDVRDPETDGA
ncbi:hypothetical protein C474_20236 [Halogeometricum pallidum JCM 14848]|uniref:Uncharacterized protein n=1 Tax=Halogeometricum pallidum JCM 14848 TaxID=1227487 RepID=M0CS85_HALPD|nr:hypothetical protein [Halogeometricum pallidum]ELZ26066.1 hypothetical protein C474_20236 [Halogeometricum pallidum JCM 14848]